METRISATQLESFVGDVRPVWLISDKSLKFEPIRWGIEGEAVTMRRMSGCFHGAMAYGVLLTFTKPGEATVTASYNGEVYTCRVICRARKDYSAEKMNFYKGDLHTHTTPEHTHDLFINRTEYLYPDYLNYINKDNKRDLAVITDHSETIDLENFFRGFLEYESMKDRMETVVFPGCESEIKYVEEDRFGRLHRRSGELVTLNANNFCQSNTYPEFFEAYENSPYVIGIFAHPHIMEIGRAHV